VEDALKANFERLETLDRLSLHLCLSPQENCVIDAVPKDAHGMKWIWICGAKAETC